MFKYGQIMLSMRVNGEKTKQMEEVSSGTQMVISTRENGKMIKLMDTELTYM